MLSDARELASDQQLDADVYIVGPGTAGISIARGLSGNGASVCRSSVRLGVRYSGWPFESTTQLDPCSHAQGVCGLGPFDDDPSRWSDTALESPRLLRLSRPAPCQGCANPTLPVVALTLRLADHIKRQLAD